MRWRQAKRMIQLDGKQTGRCGGTSAADLPSGHAPGCHGRGGRFRRWSAYHRVTARQWMRWWSRASQEDIDLANSLQDLGLLHMVAAKSSSSGA